MDPVFAQIAQIFCDESREQAQRISEALLNIGAEADGVKNALEKVFREAHSLKGSASSLGVTEIEHLAHAIEDALGPARAGKGELTSDLVDACLAAVEAIIERCLGLLADNTVGLDTIGTARARLVELQSHGHGEKDAAVMDSAAAPAVVPKPEAESKPAPQEKPVAETTAHAPGGREADQVIRVSAQRLAGMETCLTEMHALQGRLEARGRAIVGALAALDGCLQQARVSENHALVPGLLDLQRRLSGLRRAARDDSEFLTQNVVTFNEDLDAMRLVNVSTLAGTLQQAVREAARRLGREAMLAFSDGGAQVDRRLLESMKHPLLHLVRNAVAHGIEPAKERVATGKPATGTVTVEVTSTGTHIVVSVADDGAGVNKERVQARGRALGMITSDQVLTDEETFELLFRSGFSTEQNVNEIAGRGVGLDVVRDSVGKLKGHVKVTSQRGMGTTFRFEIPLSLARFETIVVRQGSQTLGLPLNGVAMVRRMARRDFKEVGGKTYIEVEEDLIPVRDMADILKLPGFEQRQEQVAILVVEHGDQRVALITDQVVRLQTSVLRPLPVELQSIEVLANLTVTEGGEPFFVLQPEMLVRSANEVQQTRHATAPRNILVADDSLTTCYLLRSTLEAYGFVVVLAGDGEQAMRLAREQHFDLVVSDVSMPRVDGFALTRALRDRTETSKIPIVLFSALAGEDDRDKGLGAGANAYVSKSDFDRGILIDVIQELLGVPQ